MHIDDGWLDQPDIKGFLEKQMVFAARMTNDFEVFHTSLVPKIMTVFAHSCGRVFIKGIRFISFYGHSEVFISSHLEVTLSLTNVDTVACVARIFIQKE